MHKTASALTSAALLTLIAPFVLAAPAAADQPERLSFGVSFVDVNPCTGENHTVTFTVTGSEHVHDGRVVVILRKEVATSTGYVGHGTESFVDNGQILKSTHTDILTSPDGDRIRARGVLVADLSTGTIRVQKGELTCLGPAQPSRG